MKAHATFLAIAVSCLLGCTQTQTFSTQPSVQKSGLGQQFDEDLASHDVIIIGEIHGTKEVPKAVADLSANISGRTLFALELKPESESLTCPPTEFPPSWKSKYADGRSSQAMLAAFCEIRDNAMRYGNEILLIDIRSAEQRTFYDAAAIQIAEKLDGGRYDNVIVLTGNYHSSRGTAHLAGALQKLGKSALTATMSSPKGTAWTCRKPDDILVCGPAETSPHFCKNQAVDESGWTADVPSEFKWDRCLTFPKVTASPPAYTRRLKEP